MRFIIVSVRSSTSLTAHLGVKGLSEMPSRVNAKRTTEWVEI
jgi:hypothetical protein